MEGFFIPHPLDSIFSLIFSLSLSFLPPIHFCLSWMFFSTLYFQSLQTVVLTQKLSKSN